MNLDDILELLKIAKERQTKGLSVPEETIAKTIIVIEKIIAKNDKMKCMGASAPAKEEPQDEIVHGVSFVLQDQHEKEFWANCYLAATATNAYGNPPAEFIADRAISELRKRQEKSDE